MVNNPAETVSTDYDTSDKLYFRALHPRGRAEHLRAGTRRCHHRAVRRADPAEPRGQPASPQISRSSAPSKKSSIEMAEDRKHFSAMLDKLGLKQTQGSTATNETEAVAVASEIGVSRAGAPFASMLGGRAMQIVHTEEELHHYMPAHAAEEPALSAPCWWTVSSKAAPPKSMSAASPTAKPA